MIDESGLDITFQVLSIDDRKMRERIKRDTRYNINYVPCILKIDKNNGVASQYEAENAFQLIQGEIRARMALKTETQIRPVQHQPAQVSFEPIEQQPATSSSHHSINPQALNSQAMLNSPNKNNNIIPKATPIEELMDLSELEEQPTESVSNDRPMGERRNIEKISVASVMAGRESMEMNAPKPVPEMDIKPVKTGQKVNVNDIMAGKQ